MKRCNKTRGFTLVEMLIVVGIFTVMSAIILANYPEFRGRSALDNLAAQVATVFREAQVYGISVRGIESDVAFGTGYGVRINLSASEIDIQLFADKNKNKVYDAGDAQLETFRLTGGERITELCAPSCVGAGGVVGTRPSSVKSLSAVFERPNPDAYFSVEDQLANVQSISIRVQNRSGSYARCIEVFTTGQISVRACE